MHLLVALMLAITLPPANLDLDYQLGGVRPARHQRPGRGPRPREWRLDTRLAVVLRDRNLTPDGVHRYC